MSESRVNRSRRPRATGGGAEDRQDALKDATPDVEPPWAIKKMGKRPEKKDGASSKD